MIYDWDARPRVSASCAPQRVTSAWPMSSGTSSRLVIGIADFSPVPIVAVMLMLFSVRAAVNGPALLLGWVLGVSVVTAIGLVVSNSGGEASDSGALERRRGGSSHASARCSLSSPSVSGGAVRSRESAGFLPDERDRTLTPTRALAVGFGSGPEPEELRARGRRGDDHRARRLVGGEAGSRRRDLRGASECVDRRPGGGRSCGTARALLDGWQDWLTQNIATVTSVVLLIKIFIFGRRPHRQRI